jgi:hypothetical protein
LLPLIEKTPAHWKAIGLLAKLKTGHSESFADIFQAWHTQISRNTNHGSSRVTAAGGALARRLRWLVICRL